MTDPYQQSGASSTQMTLNKRPLLELHEVEVNVMKVCQDMDANNAVVSRDKLEYETIEFKMLLMVFIFTAKALTARIAATPALAGELEPSVQYDMKMIEAMSTFFDERMGDIPDIDGGTPEEQARRKEVRRGYQKRINEIKKQLATRRG